MIPRAVGDKIIVEKPQEDGPHAEGGIIIPESLQRTPRFGGYVVARVLSVGARVTEFKPGNKILMRAVWGDDYFYDGRTITILTERMWRDCCHA